MSIRATAVHFLQDYMDIQLRITERSLKYRNTYIWGKNKYILGICSIRHKMQTLRMDFLGNYK